MRAALVLASKDLKVLVRDRVALFWAIGFPLVFALFFGAVMSDALDGGGGRLALRVVDESRSEVSTRLRQMIAETELFELRDADLASAREDVRRGRAVGYVRIPTSFTLDEGNLELGVDPSRKLEGRMVSRALDHVVTSLEGLSIFDESGRVERAEIAGRTRTSLELVFPAAMLWGLIGCASAFAVSLVSERRRGTLSRLRTAPIALHTIFAGKSLACFTACAATAMFLFAVGHAFLDIRAENPVALAVATTCLALCFVGITLALSTLGSSEQSVAGAGWSVLIVMAMLGGAMVPLDLMPEWLAAWSDASPVKWGILALEGAMWRGFEPAELAKPCAILLAIGALGFLVGFARLVRLTRSGAH
ncbi:MAG: ABC transporter permease [Polyangiaceae bacterium]|nr:ABC transporter permease [Polyangiaceae bacterium]